MYHRGVAHIRLLKTHRKTTELLEVTKEILHQMTPLVHLPVVVDLIDAIRSNHRRRTALFQLVAAGRCCVGPVQSAPRTRRHQASVWRWPGSSTKSQPLQLPRASTITLSDRWLGFGSPFCPGTVLMRTMVPSMSTYRSRHRPFENALEDAFECPPAEALKAPSSTARTRRASHATANRYDQQALVIDASFIPKSSTHTYRVLAQFV